jgi:hypothetical protein
VLPQSFSGSDDIPVTSHTKDISFKHGQFALLTNHLSLPAIAELVLLFETKRNMPAGGARGVNRWLSGWHLHKSREGKCQSEGQLDFSRI